MIKTFPLAVLVLLLAVGAQAQKKSPSPSPPPAPPPRSTSPPPPTSLLPLTFSYSSSFSDVCDSDGKVDDSKVANLVQVLLGDSSVTTSNIQFIGNCKCAGVANIKSPHHLAGTFDNEVVVLSTGQAKVAVKEQNAVSSWSTFMNYTTVNKKAVDSGDADVAADVAERLGVDVKTYDACGIEFDLNIPKSMRKQNRKSSLAFPFVFASEEYLEYTDPAFGKSDQFGFYIGSDKTNIAKFQVDLGGGYKSDPTLVTCDNLNPDNYPQLYNANTEWKMSASGQEHEVLGDLNTEWDGLTNKMTTMKYSMDFEAKVPVKLVIADVDDNRVDSAVYIQGGISICGDGIVQDGEACDDGNDDNYDGCNNWCNPSQCLRGGPEACGDPHIKSFDGADFMFTGFPDATFNMLSHPSYQINTFFRKYRKQDASKTWIGAVGMMIGGQDKIEVTGVKKGTMTVKVNDVEMSLNTVQTLAGSGTKIAFAGDVDGDKDVSITTPDMVIVIEIGAENWNLDFDIEKISLELGAMHGILGQSYMRMVEQRSAISQGKTVPHPVAGVEGEEVDYNVPSGLFGTDFKFNKYQGVAVDASAAKASKTGASSARKALEVDGLVNTPAGHLFH